MITYVLTLSQTFPATHKRKGEPTCFFEKIAAGIKMHTIRGNYELWKKRFEKIERGEARLSVRVWTASPYNYAKDGSKQKEVFSFDNTDGIGIQKIEFDDWLYSCLVDGNRISFSWENIAGNDGLSNDDFEDWFKGSLNKEPKVIIHFTKFRY